MKNSDERREGAGGRVVLVVVLVLALLVGGAYAGAYAYAGDKVPRGTEISGVDVGGLAPDDAAQALAEGLDPLPQSPIEVSVDGRTAEIEPTDAGLAVDYAASVAAAGAQRSWQPDRIWDFYTGGQELEAVVTVDEEALAATITELEQGLGTRPVNAKVRFVDGRTQVRDAVPGTGLDPATTRDRLVEAYLTGESAELEITTLEPAISDDDVQDAIDAFATPALSGPVTLTFGTARVELQPGDFADALGLRPVGGVLEPTVDPDVVVPLVEGATAGDGAPVDASIELVDGKPRIVKAKPGISFEPDDVTAALLEVVTRPEGEREIEVEGSVEQPEFTTKDARDLGVRRRVSAFTTYFPYAEYRNVNIGRAAELVDGTLLKPGEIFSMNDIVGERTRENGFTEGFIISNGIFAEDLGGGVSQMATTLFNGMFFAGLKDVEHKPHSFYIDRYPVGREATVAWGSVDLRFQNDTDYGVLVSAQVTPSTPSSQGVVTVKMYSTKVWDIETTTSERYAYVAPGTRTLDTPGCYPNSGYSGFQVDVTRIFKKPGSDEVDHREVFHTDYTPSDTVICKPPGSLGN